MEPGLYLTFFTDGEASDRELPPVGPLEHVVIREHLIVADREALNQTAEVAGGSRWIEAELELQRAMGSEPGGPRRPHLRIAAREGVYLRFASFGDSDEQRPLSELGPFAVVVLGPRGVEADGELVAAHSRRKHARWELRGRAAKLGKAFRPDIAFRTRSTSYHPGIESVRLVVSRQSAAVGMSPESAGALQASRSAPPAHRAGPTKLAGAAPPQPILQRLAVARQTDSSMGVAPARRAFRLNGLAGAAWRLRLGIIAALLLLNAAFALVSFEAVRGPERGTAGSVVGIGKDVQSSRWVYNVTSVRRVPTAGSARAQGVFLVIQVAAINRGPNSAELSPSYFLLVDADRRDYSALPTASAVYQNTANPDSPFVWAQTYPVGRSVATNVIFDVNPSIRSPRLAIADVPGTWIRLD